MKKLFVFLLIGMMFAVTMVSASEKITTLPDDVGSFEEWKIRMLQANQDDGFFSASTGNYWGLCENTCIDLIFGGDCNPCKSGEVASSKGWHPDSMSVMSYWSSANSFCNDPFAGYNYYNVQAFCKVPTTECSGGADTGDRKCVGNEIWECDNSGTWDYVSGCSFQCSAGSCQEEQCTPHATERCDGDNIYWFNSCGEREGESERCESDEVCSGNECVRNCDAGLMGSPICSGDKISQQYQFADCTTEIRNTDTCTFGCENAQCVDPQCESCEDPTAWSQCESGEMFRTNYKCGADSDYRCESFTETQACECGTTGQCDYDETCESSVCVEVECSEDQIADNHECLDKSSISPVVIISIVIGAFVFILVIIIVVMMMKLKGGQNKNVKK